MKDNQPKLAEELVDRPWWDSKADFVERDRGHGRTEVRTLRVLPVRAAEPLADFPSARQMIMVVRERATLRGQKLGEPDVVFAITSLSRKDASPRAIAGMLRGHWSIENGLHYVRDVTFDEDRSRIRTGSGPRVMASLRNLAIAIHRLNGETNIARAVRKCCQKSTRAFVRLCARTAVPVNYAA